MSREIKFRAWNKEEKTMCTKPYDSPYALEVGSINEYLKQPDYLKEYEYMQYIGIKDKNGKEIYEGDIVRTNSGRICKVVWFSSPQYQGWDLEPIESKNPVPKPTKLWEGLEVVGNVYENADLLKEDGNE